MSTSPSLPGACDCHVHVFYPVAFPYAADRAYTPPAATVPQLKCMLNRLSLERVVLVQPSVYGTDNRCMLEALRQLGTDNARGIAVVDLGRISDEELGELHEAGVRGVRLNLKVSESSFESAVRELTLARRLKAMPGWCVQVHASLDVAVSLFDAFRSLELPVVLDHFAGGLSPDPRSERQFAQLIGEMRRANLHVKLSAPYRLWASPGAPSPVALARRLCIEVPDRVLWGSDWPHTGGSGRRQEADPHAVEPFRKIDNEQVLGQLLAALPSDDLRQRLLVRNPARLYGFRD